MDNTGSCPNCGSKTLYRSREVSAGGGYAPNYLPGLARVFRVGLLTYHIENDTCEIVTLDSLRERRGIKQQVPADADFPRR